VTKSRSVKRSGSARRATTKAKTSRKTVRK
jgi:hypothetical protein